ncbi:hypothetical protein [Hafnia alvei]|uniref:hypothetical protein n=1 Tax=Hafnia alvei TaxID=569 RepID=UPI0024A7EB65|nr:hypothetical protein [Hafnia alvei]
MTQLFSQNINEKELFRRSKVFPWSNKYCFYDLARYLSLKVLLSEVYALNNKVNLLFYTAGSKSVKFNRMAIILHTFLHSLSAKTEITGDIGLTSKHKDIGVTSCASSYSPFSATPMLLLSSMMAIFSLAHGLCRIKKSSDNMLFFCDVT